MTKSEKETIILFDEASETANIYTHNRRMIHKLDKLCRNYAGFEMVEGDGRCNRYTVPKKRVVITTPRK